MPNFKCLYYFTSSEIDVLEIQRTDLPEDAPLSDKYKWLMLPTKTGKVFELDFKSMSKGSGEETRSFIGGDFQFNANEGQLSLLGRMFKVDCRLQSEVPEDLMRLAAEHLSEDIQLNNHCSFRYLKPSDVQYFKRWIFDEGVIRYSMTKFHKIFTEAQVIDWFYATLVDSKTFQLGIIDSKTKELIGYAGIASINDVDNNGEYFIFIGNKSYWGKGIASSVTKQIVKSGFENLKLHRIFLTASSSNPGAIRAYEKAGFVHEGRMRDAFFRNNEHSDKIFMGILRSEWCARQDSNL